MPVPTVISKVITPDGATLLISFSATMATAGTFAIEGYTVGAGAIHGTAIAYPVSPRVPSDADLTGALTPTASPTSTSGDPLTLWPSDSSPDGDVINLSGYTPMTSYLTVDEADALAASLFGLTAWADATDADKLKALVTASARIDHSRRWQGAKYNLDADLEVIEQDLEFPRMDGSTPIAIDPEDPTSQVPIVPAAIEQATLWEADSLLAGQRAARLRDRHDGLASQSVGSASESYRPLTGHDGTPILCLEAEMLCRRYQLRSGRLL